MDNKTAKSNLRELRDSLSKVLGEEDKLSSSEITEQSQEAIQQARKATSQLKKSLLDRVKEIPVVQKVSELGTAGTVAVATAGTAQVGIATDITTVFVADIANDVVEERFEVPVFIDHFIDFHELNDWGQQVISEKVSELQPTSEQSVSDVDTKPQPSASSQDTASDTPSDKTSEEKPTETKQQSEVKESKSEEKETSKEGDQEESKKETPKEPQEEKTEAKQESQEKSSDEPTKSVEAVKTPFIPIDDPIKPHSLVNPSPVQ